MLSRCPAQLRAADDGMGRLVQDGLLQQRLGGQGVGKYGEGEGSPVRGTSKNKRMERGRWLHRGRAIRRGRAPMK